MSVTRTRSSSVGRAREGINPYEREVSSPQQEQSIEVGRETMLRKLEALVGCQVKFVQTVMRGSEPMDQFSFRSADTSHRDQIGLFAKLQALAGTARTSEGVTLVFVRQSRYDHRAPGLDFTPCQCAFIVAMTLLALALALFALGHMWTNGTAGAWIAGFVDL